MQLGPGSKDENRFKMSTFDQLISPLRVDNPFGKFSVPFFQNFIYKNKLLWTFSNLFNPLEIWAPKEIALFEACICKFGKNFYNFP